MRPGRAARLRRRVGLFIRDSCGSHMGFMFHVLYYILWRDEEFFSPRVGIWLGQAKRGDRRMNANENTPRPARARRRRIRRWLISLAVVVATVSIVGLSPLQGTLLQAILLGPDSLFPVPSVRAMIVVRHGHKVAVP